MDGSTRRSSASLIVRRQPTRAEEAHICEGLVPRGDGDRAVLVVVALAGPAVWAELCAGSSEAELGAVLEHAWTFFDVVPRIWHFETRASLGPALMELARRHGATARTLASHRPMARGPGESALRRVPERLLRRHVLRDLDHANRLLLAVVEEWDRGR